MTMNRSLGEWADITAELANRRLPEWRDRLKRPVEYSREKLGEIARAAHKNGILSDEAALDVIQSGFSAHEFTWNVEWAARQNIKATRH
jgi:hypothetical protein